MPAIRSRFSNSRQWGRPDFGRPLDLAALHSPGRLCPPPTMIPPVRPGSVPQGLWMSPCGGLGTGDFSTGRRPKPPPRKDRNRRVRRHPLRRLLLPFRSNPAASPLQAVVTWRPRLSQGYFGRPWNDIRPPFLSPHPRKPCNFWATSTSSDSQASRSGFIENNNLH